MGIVRAFSLSILLALCAAAQGALPTGKELGQTIREAGLDPLACFHVRDLSYSKGAIRLYFNEGYLIFSRPVMGQRLVAVFTTEIEGGDGEVLLIPPSRSERQSLASFTKSPTLDEHLRDGLLIFTDLSGNTLLDQLTRGEGGRPAPEMGPLLAGQWNPVVANITQPLENRVIEDLLSTQAAEKGMVLAAVSGRSLGAFDLISDGRAEHRIAIRQSRGSQDGYDVWSSFLPRGTAAFRDDGEVRPLQYDIHAEIGADLQVKAASKQIGRAHV